MTKMFRWKETAAEGFDATPDFFAGALERREHGREAEEIQAKSREKKRADYASDSMRIVDIEERPGACAQGSSDGAGNAGQSAYAASKAALIGFTKAIARELASRNVRVNAVSPGFIETDMTARISGEAREKLAASIPLARLGTADEVARAVAFLASEQASYITGEVLRVNGGLLT